VVESARLDVGVKVVAEPEVLAVPATTPPPLLTVNEVVVKLAGSMASEKVTPIVVLSATSVMVSAGDTDKTVGAVVSCGGGGGGGVGALSVPPPPHAVMVTSMIMLVHARRYFTKSEVYLIAT